MASHRALKPSGGDAAAVEARIGDILKWHEENGLPVFDPHTHILEDGGMKVTDWAQLGFKRRVTRAACSIRARCERGRSRRQA